MTKILSKTAGTMGASLSPDAVIKSEDGKFDCIIDDETLSSIRMRAAKLVWRAGEKAYSHFPIDRNRLYGDLIGGTITKKNICTALLPSTVTEKDHNEKRWRYTADRLSEKAAASVGVVGTAVPLFASCPDGYDWVNSPYYAGADSCEDVTEEFGKKGIPTAMYSTDLSAVEAGAYLGKPSTAPLYTRYACEGPVRCESSSVDGAFYHLIHVWGAMNAAFAMTTYGGGGWSAWALSNECTKPDGEVMRPADIMFDFGIRVFVPLEIELNGKIVQKTLVISQVAAASEGILAKLVPAHIPLERFYGGEYAKKILMDAKAKGWKIDRKR